MARGSVHGDADGTRQAPAWLIAACVILAAANLAAGVALVLQPERTSDFARVVDWSRAWLAGVDVYAAADASIDYPPPALVSLSPLAMLPARVAVPLWTSLNALMAIGVALLSARLVAPSFRGAALVAPIVLLLPPFRTLAQFSIAAFLPALAGFLLAPRHPIGGGIAIGVSLVKPQIGGPALLWAVVTRRWATAGWAVATQAVLAAAYLAWVGATPPATLGAYAAALAREQNRADLLPGVTSLQPLVDWVALPPLVVQAGIAGVLAAGLVAIWMRRARDFDLRFFAAASLLSLLAFRHLSYNLLLAIPALAFAWRHGDRAIRMLGVIACALLVASPPTFWRHVAEPWMGATMFDPVVGAAYRAALVLLFALVVFSRAADRPSGLPRSSA